MKLYIKPENDLIISMYENHSHYHPGIVVSICIYLNELLFNQEVFDND